MSAYIVDNETINRYLTIVRRDAVRRSSPLYGSLGRLYGEPTTVLELTAIGQRLLAMNREAVHQRYPDVPIDHLPGPINPEPYNFSGDNHPTIAGYKAAQCLSYQCAEGDVPETEEYKRLTDAINHIAQAIVAQLPEYEAAHWG
jgi:hypothetical protein